ncbi:MAG: glutamate formimidoyltransferase [Deltaproteobacteria bacterium]|nr:glutamate formimidoyltransferase [Deltaproteobacteria bacterium]
MKVLECVPNFSEGRNRRTVERIVEALGKVDGVAILDYSMDLDHHRSVVTFIGTPEAVEQGAAAACDAAVKLIDMRNHTGIHPRNGAVDVVPFIPVLNVDMTEAAEVAHRFGRSFAIRNDIPVYFYGEAALDPSRKRLPFLRRGGYEMLREKMSDPRWHPDAGPSAPNRKSGATAVGARDFLIAFNINLATNDVAIAKKIAAEIRQSSGGFTYVQAMGVLLKSRDIAQVSMNLTNYKETSVRTVYHAVKDRAAALGVDILESEIIGCLPGNALDGITPDEMKLCDFSNNRIIETHCPGLSD